MPDDAPKGDCIDESQALDLLSGRLTSNAAIELRRHAGGCGACRQLLAAVAKVVAGAPELDSDAEPTLVERTGAPRIGSTIAPGTAIGSYSVLSQIGSGGMGIVYAAYDPGLDRKIALKLLHQQGVGDGRSERLRREAQAMAKLSHPNVAAVHEVGSSPHGVYVAMEFVQGQTLESWLRAEPRSWTDVLEMFSAAGRGLTAAHAAGVVHRDFKPQNVLVGDDGRPRVLDFGLAVSAEAQRTADSSSSSPGPQRLTQTGALMGTPAYMAPEQHLGVTVGPKTDQFSFCVALYEGLWGERPFAGDNYASLADAVTVGRVRPFNPGSKTPAWLRRIVLRGLEVDAADRWPSMDDLLARLADDPTRTRRRWLVAGTAAILIAGFATASQLHERARLADCELQSGELPNHWRETRGTVAQAMLSSGVSYAATTWERAEPWLSRYAERWSGLRNELCVAATVTGSSTAELYERSLACLEQRRAAFESLEAVLADADATIVEQAVASAAGLPAVAACADDRSGALFDQSARDNVSELRAQLARARVLMAAGLYDASAELLDDVRSREETSLRPELLVAAGTLADLRDDHDGAEAALTEAFYAAGAVGDDATANDAAGRLVLVVGKSQARLDEGLVWGRLSDMAMRRGGDTDPLRRATLLDRLGQLHEIRGTYDDALASFRDAHAIREQQLGEDHPQVASTLRSVGQALATKGDYGEAVSALRRALEVSTEALGPDHPTVARVLATLGNMHRNLGAYDEALGSYTRALEILEAAGGPDTAGVANVHNALGIFYGMRGSLDESRAHTERALAIKERLFGSDHPEVATSLSNLGAVQLERGDHRGALELHRRALAIRERSLGPNHAHVGISLTNVALAWVGLDALDLARPNLERGLEIFEVTFGPKHPRVAQLLTNIAELEFRSGRYRRSFDRHARALAIQEPLVGDRHPDIARALIGMGDAYLELGEPDEAVPLFRRAAWLRERSKASNPDLATPLFSLAQALRETGAPRAQVMATAGRALELFREAGERHEEAVALVTQWLARTR